MLKQLLKQMYQTHDLTRPGQRPGESIYIYAEQGPGTRGHAAEGMGEGSGAVWRIFHVEGFRLSLGLTLESF